MSRVKTVAPLNRQLCGGHIPMDGSRASKIIIHRLCLLTRDSINSRRSLGVIVNLRDIMLARRLAKDNLNLRSALTSVGVMKIPLPLPLRRIIELTFPSIDPPKKGASSFVLFRKFVKYSGMESSRTFDGCISEGRSVEDRRKGDR